MLRAVLQYRLWIGEGSLAEQQRLEKQLEEHSDINRVLRTRNAVLEREVLELQNGMEGVERRAREELGLIREGEVFYQFVDKEDAAAIRPRDSDSDRAGAP